VVFPLFTLGFYIYYRQVCGAAARGLALPGQIRRYCQRFVGSWTDARLRVSGSLGMKVLTQALVVALPEEYFFRGYVQSRLEQVWPSRRRLLGARVGLPLLLASTLFALGHLLVDFNGLRLAVFFPGLLFGWMRELTGSILAPVLFHASSNLISEVLHDAFRN
jgi:membrane protease YdiL (CAAX protease family)